MIDYSVHVSWSFTYRGFRYSLKRLDSSAYRDAQDRLTITGPEPRKTWWVDASLVDGEWLLTDWGSFDGFRKDAKKAAAQRLLQHVVAQPLPWTLEPEVPK